jgi:DeoR-like helix-turn-helix domain
MNIRNQIDRRQLQRLYSHDALTIDKIASIFRCSPTTIRRRLSELGIATRSRGPDIKRSRQLEWSPNIAYAVGLITTDGNLSSDGRHLSITSADIDLLETIRSCWVLRILLPYTRPAVTANKFITGFNGATRRFTNG